MQTAMWVLRMAIFNPHKSSFDQLGKKRRYVMQILFYGRPHLQVRWNLIHCSQKIKPTLTEKVAAQALLWWWMFSLRTSAPPLSCLAPCLSCRHQIHFLFPNPPDIVFSFLPPCKVFVRPRLSELYNFLLSFTYCSDLSLLLNLFGSSFLH